MNEHKIMTFCVLTPKRIGHCVSYFLVVIDNVKGRQLWLLLTDEFFSLAKHVSKKDMRERKDPKTARNCKLKC